MVECPMSFGVRQITLIKGSYYRDNKCTRKEEKKADVIKKYGSQDSLKQMRIIIMIKKNDY